MIRIESRGDSSSRPPSRPRLREFYEDSASSSSSSPSASFTGEPCTAGPHPARSAPPVTTSHGAPSRAAAPAAPSTEALFRQRQGALATLAAAAGAVQDVRRPPSRGPAPRPSPFVPRHTLQPVTTTKSAAATSSFSTSAAPRSLGMVLVENGRQAMEEEVRHWRHRCGTLESELVKAVAELDTARGALVRLQSTGEPSAPSCTLAARRSGDAAAVTDARQWRAMANAFLSTRPAAAATTTASESAPLVPATASLVSPHTPRRPSPATTTTTLTVPAESALVVHSPFSEEREGTPTESGQEWAARSLSPPTPAYHAYEMLLSGTTPLTTTTTTSAAAAAGASSPSFAPPPQLARDVVRRGAAASGVEGRSDGEAPLRPLSTSPPTSVDSQELVYDVIATAASEAERERAKAALAAIHRSQGAVAPAATPTAARPAVTAEPTATTSTTRHDEDTTAAVAPAASDKAVQGLEAELRALRLERDDLETTLLSTQEQLIRLEDEHRAAASTTPAALSVGEPPLSTSPSPLLVTPEDAAALVARLRQAIHALGVDDDNVDSSAAVDGNLDASAANANHRTWETVAREAARLADGAEAQCVRLLELQEELHIVRADRNELMGQQSEPVRRLQEQLLAREQANVQLMETLAQRDALIAALTRAKADAEAALSAQRLAGDTAQAQASLAAELADVKRALEVKETALRIALRESLQSPVTSPSAPVTQLRERSSPNVPQPALFATAAGDSPGRAASVGSTRKRASALATLLASPEAVKSTAQYTPARTGRKDAQTAPRGAGAAASPGPSFTLGPVLADRSGSVHGADTSPRPLFASPDRSSDGSSVSTQERLRRRKIRAAQQDNVMAQHREVWQQQERLFDTESY